MFTYVIRGRKRIPAIDLGDGLLRPTPMNGRSIVAAAREVDIDLALGVTPVELKKNSITVVRHNGGSKLIAGGDGRQRDYFSSMTQDEKIDAELYGRRSYRSWKERRQHKYK